VVQVNSQPIKPNTVSQDPTVNKIVRKYFRVPVDAPDQVWVKINNTKYSVCDICLDGVGVTLEDPGAFQISQTVADCELKISDLVLKGLNGQVVHFSLNAGKDWQLGIHWTALEEEEARRILDKVSVLKKELLSNDD
jgi:hypothetical protein